MKAGHLTMIWMATMLTICLMGLGSSLQAAPPQSTGEMKNNASLKISSVEQAGDQANTLIATINALVARNEQYTTAMKGASPEDQKVLELQVWELRKHIAKDVLKLGDVLLTLENKAPQPQLRKQVESIYAYALPRFPFRIDRLRKEIDRTRAERTKAAVNERYSIEIQIAKTTAHLDEIFNTYLNHIQQMDHVGMDIKKARRDLVQLLNDRTDELSGRIVLAASRIHQLEEHRKVMPDYADAATLLAASTKSLNTSTTSMENMLGLKDALELNTEVLRSELMTITQDFSSGLMNTGVAINLVSQTVKNVTGWLVSDGPKYLLKILVMIGILFVFSLAARFLRAGLGRAMESSKLNLSQLARRMIINTASNLVMLFGLMLALSQLGISLGPLLAGFGVAGFIIGFALQDTLGNFASGMMILLYRPYDIGDLVDVGGVVGKVNKMSLVSTSLLTVDNQLIVIPNNKIWGDVIKNVTAQDKRRIDMVFGIAYTDDIPKAEKILEDILQSHDRVLDDPEPIVRLHTLGASSVDFVVRPWVKVDDYWDVYWDVTRSVKLRFDDEGVSIPFPQRDVHVYHETMPVSINNSLPFVQRTQDISIEPGFIDDVKGNPVKPVTADAV